jgi:hypothetical protein
MLAIQKIFFVSHLANYAVSSMDGEAVFAWVDIDAVPSPVYLPVMIGFPDARKIHRSKNKLVLVTNQISVPTTDHQTIPARQQQQFYMVPIPMHTVMIGGAEAWAAMGTKCEERLNQTVIMSEHHVSYWVQELRLTEFGSSWLHTTVSTVDLFYTSLFNGGSDVFCLFQGNKIVFDGDNLLPASRYLLYQFSANPVSDLQCIDSVFFNVAKVNNGVRDFEVVV